MILCLKTDFHRLTDESVAVPYKARVFSTLPSRKHEKVIAVVHEGAPVGVNPEDLVQKLQEVIAAVTPPAPTGQRPPRRSASPGRSTLGMPDAKWGGGCWHCGKPWHSRKQCRGVHARVRQHKTLPKEYAGKY